MENVHSNDTFGGSALIRHGIATDSSIDAPTIVTDEDIQTGASEIEMEALNEVLDRLEHSKGVLRMEIMDNGVALKCCYANKRFDLLQLGS